jgi:hypothetical protein
MVDPDFVKARDDAFASQTAVGQFTPGLLSQRDSRLQVTSGELRSIPFRQVNGVTQTIVQPQESIIVLSEKFVGKAQEAGIPIARTVTGAAFVPTNVVLPTLPGPASAGERTAEETLGQASNGGFNLMGLIPLVILGVALLGKR